MSRIDIAFLIVEGAARVNFVRKDPPVIRAARKAGVDIRRAADSSIELGKTIGDSWTRAGNRFLGTA